MTTLSRRIAIAAAVVGISLAGAAAAIPRMQEHLLYYAEPELFTVVGSYTSTCSGNVYREGQVTPYVEIISSEDCTKPRRPGQPDLPPQP